MTQTSTRAVVIVSGGDAVSPFTTPDRACARGLAAGNTDTALRERLLRDGIPVYTAPAMNARGPVVEPRADSFGAFGGMPEVLPAHMTIVSTGDIDNAGEHLARFIGHLHAEYGVAEVDWIGHSNGGLFALAASRVLGETGSPVRVGSLTAIGTPWEGGVLNRVVYGEVPSSVLGGSPESEALMAGFRDSLDRELGLADQDTRRYLLGEHGWLAAQRGVLGDAPVLLIGGGALTAPGPDADPSIWPHDGFVSDASALAHDIPEGVLENVTRRSYPLLHSIFVADAFGRAWQDGLTWNVEVLDEVARFIRTARG